MPKDRSDDSLFADSDSLEPQAPQADPAPVETDDVGGTPAEGDPLGAGEENTVKVRYTGNGENARVSVGGYEIDFAGGDQEVPRSVAQSAAESFDTVEVVD